MKITRLLLLICVLTTSFTSLWSQANQVQIKGIVLDSIDAAPLEMATVIALDSLGQFYLGTTTNKKGEYDLSLPLGSYQLQYSFVGYKNQTKFIDLRAGKLSDLNTLLIPAGYQLSEVAVVGERSTVEHRIDRKLIHLGKDLQAIGDAAGVLDQIAEVQVDPDGQVQLRGSNQVVLLLNGKPSPLSNSDLLQQLSAGDIVRIELITTPSVKFQADGLSGMINIITRTKTKAGFQGSLNTSASSNEQYQANLRLSYGTPTFGVNLGGGLSDRSTLNTRTRTRISPELGYDQFSSNSFVGGVKRFNIGIDYLLGSRHQFSGQIQSFNNFHEIISASTIEEKTLNTTDSYLFTANNNHEHLSTEYNLNYRYSLPKADHFLEIEWHRSINANDLQANYLSDNLNTNQQLDYRNQIDNLALDYSWPIDQWKAHLESGLLLTFKQAQNTPSGQQLNGEDIENTFIYDEQILGAYGLLRKSWKAWQLQTGLRYEIYQSEALFTQPFQNDFKNFFPSLHISFAPKESWRTTFAYNRRISRPSLWNINPFSNPSNRFFLNQGNPELTPEFSHNAELGAQFTWNKISFYPTFFLRYKTNLINQTYSLQGEQTIQSFVNEGRSLAYGLELSAQFQLFEFWEVNASGNAYREQLYGSTFLSGQTRLYSGNTRLRNEFQLGKKWAIDLSWQYAAPGQRRFSTQKVRQKADVAIRWKVLNDQAQLGFRLTDVFNTYDYRSTLIATDFLENYRYKGRLEWPICLLLTLSKKALRDQSGIGRNDSFGRRGLWNEEGVEVLKCSGA